MIRSTELTLVKRRSTWDITSKTSPTTIVELENVFFDNEFKQAGEHVSIESASEGPHDPKVLRWFQE
jgi:hypothetical protein